MARTAVIMQPTYLPWLGYFDLIDQSDICVFLDDVQFSRQSWQQRNRIRTPKGLEWLTVPVRRRGHLKSVLQETEVIQGTGFPYSHIRGIELNYRRASFFDAFFPRLREILSASEKLLCEVNLRLIRWLAGEMRIKTAFETSSSLGAQGRRSELMIDICRRVGAETYLSPAGATYLGEELDIIKKKDVKVFFHNYNHPVYRQVFEPFMPYASVIDLLFNEGDKAADIIRSGRMHSLPLKAFLGDKSCKPNHSSEVP